MATFKLFNNHIKVTFIYLAAVEAFVFYGSLFLAAAIRFGTFDLHSEEIVASIGNINTKALIFTLAHMLSMTSLGLYQIDQFRGKSGFQQMAARITVSMFLVAIVLIVLFYVFPSFRLGRGITALAFAIMLVTLILIQL